MRSLLTYACAATIAGSLGCTGPEGPAGPQGPKGEPGPDASPGVVSLQPARAFIGRRASIQIGAVSAHFDQERTRLDVADANIKVERLTVLSPTLLQAELAIGPADPTRADTYARIGPHDLTLTTTLQDRSESLSVKGVPVEAPLRVVPVDAALKPAAPLRQGGVARFLLQSQDPSVPLDSTFALSILDERVTVVSRQYSRDRVLVSAMIDLDAPPSAALFLRPPAGAESLTFALPAGVGDRSLTIEPRKPVELQPGKDVTDKLIDGNDSKLYKLPGAAAERLLRLTLSRGVSGSAVPAMAVLPESGKWRDRVPVLSVPGAAQGQTRAVVLAPAGKALHLLAYDAQGAQPMEYTLSAPALELHQPKDPAPSADPTMPNKQIDLSKGANHLPAVTQPVSRHYYEITPQQSGKLAVLAGLNPASRSGVQLEVRGDSCAGAVMVQAYPDGSYNTTAIFDAQAGKSYCVAVSRYYTLGPTYSLTLAPMQ